MQIKRLLLPIKGQRVDQDTLRFASNLVRHEHGSICLLYVIEVPRQYPVDAELPTEAAKCEDILHNAEECHTDFAVERIRNKLSLFVQNDAFPRSKGLLDETRIVVISGIPGIGKTNARR